MLSSVERLDLRNNMFYRIDDAIIQSLQVWEKERVCEDVPVTVVLCGMSMFHSPCRRSAS